MMDDETREFADGIRRLAERSESLRELALSTYKDRRDTVKASAVLVCRCTTDGCLLLHVWRSPAGLMFFQPSYRLSPVVNAKSSNESGRQKNTTDGDRRWKPTAGRLDDLRDWGPQAGLQLTCDHVREFVSSRDLFADADAATPGKPTRRNVPMD